MTFRAKLLAAREHRRTGWVALVGLSSVTACLGAISLDDRSCPCATGYVCCPTTRVCVSSLEEGCFPSEASATESGTLASDAGILTEADAPPGIDSDTSPDGPSDATWDVWEDVREPDVVAPDALSPDGASTPPSCAPGGAGMTTCGPGGSGQESCCTTLEVEGGTYYRTYTNDDGGPTGENDPATVSSFSLDKYLVTVGRFRQFVTAWNNGQGWMPADGSGKHTYLNGGRGLETGAGSYETGWDAADWNNTTYVVPTDANLECQSGVETWTHSESTWDNLPINCMLWYEAYAFCIWDGGFLPSEAEWEYAAAGGSLQREYPWGSTDPGTANQYALYGNYPTGNLAALAPVGAASLGVGYFGQFDLAGDVFEWNLDWWSASYVGPCTDCVNVSPSNDRVIRGGCYEEDGVSLLAAARAGEPPGVRSGGVGFRCARAP